MQLCRAGIFKDLQGHWARMGEAEFHPCMNKLVEHFLLLPSQRQGEVTWRHGEGKPMGECGWINGNFWGLRSDFASWIQKLDNEVLNAVPGCFPFSYLHFQCLFVYIVQRKDCK